MHDDRTMVEARLHRVLNERIRPAMRSARVPLTVTAWDAPGEPVPVEEALAAPFAPFPVGGAWGRPWGTTWFRMEGRVPAEWAGRRVEAVLNLGFGNAPGFQSEGLLWVERDGRHVPWRGLHPFNHDVPVADPARGGEAVTYLLEAAANPSLVSHRPSRSSDVLTAGTSPIYVLSKAELVVVETEVLELREDARCLTELMEQLSLSDPRRHEILRALERMLDLLVLDDVVGTAATARGALAEVLARPATASAHRISAIGHAHIDSAWLWPIRETKRKCARTFSNVLTLMDQYPELQFACSQAAQYEWMRERYPSVFAGIADRVAEGRWIPTGGMWVEPDVNLPSGESLVRQLTFGQRYFEEHFGVRCTEGWLPDVFGYTAALPQLLRLAGIDRFLTQKLSWNKTNRFPHHSFWWEGLDGSTVFTHFPPIDSYNALFSPLQLLHAVRNFADKGRATRSVAPFGFGDGGGGPTRQMLEQFRRVRDLEGLPRVEIEPPSAYFDAAIEEYPDAPRWVGELYFETHRGTYTSQARTKQGNRRCELLLHEAELWGTAAFGTTPATGYPADPLDRIWKEVLLHQFHDILPGSSIAWVHREAEATYAALGTELSGLVEGALARIAGRAGATVLANAAPVPRHEVVLLPAGEGATVPAGVAVQELSGGEVAAMAALPALGAVPLEVALRSAVTAPPVTVAAAEGGGTVIANGLLAVTVDTDGLLARVVATDPSGNRRELLAPGTRGNLLQLHPDFPTEYDAWDLDEHYRRQVTDLVAADEVVVVDAGPLVARVRVRRSFRSSTVEQTYELAAGSPRLTVRTDLDWHERDHVLKAAFPLDLQTDELTREIQFGHITTKIHTNTSWDAARFEVCAHRWVHAGEPGFGVALLNDGRYGHDATRTRSEGPASATVPTTMVRLTLVTGAQYPDPHADEGRHTFAYALLPTDGTVDAAVAEGHRLNLAVRLAHPPTGTADDPADAATDGPDPTRPIAHVRSGSVLLGTVKPADDRSGDLVLRLHECRGARTRAVVELAAPATGVAVVDLLEEVAPDLPAVPLALDGALVHLELRPFQVVTMRVAGIYP